MRSSQSSDQFIAGAWTGGKVSALPALPRHPRGTAFHERSRLSARQILSARVGHDHVKSSPHKPPHCALSNAHALSVRTSTYPRPSNICAIHDNVNGLSFYDLTQKGDTLAGRSLGTLVQGAKTTDCRAMCVGPSSTMWA